MFGLVVEGDYDKSAYKAFISKYLEREPHYSTRVCGGTIRKKWRNYLNEFKFRAENGENIDWVVIASDSDKKNPESVFDGLHSQAASNFNLPFPVTFALSVRELEAWLLADEIALSTLIKKPVNPFEGNLEEYPNPKGDLEDLLFLNNVVYTSQKAGEIAALADLNKVKMRCSWFKKFLDDLSPCQ